jgi:hypothetical protein
VITPTHVLTPFCGPVGPAAEYWAPYMRPAPTLSSAETAGEMVENYWMYLTRDVKFSEFHADPTIALAVENINKLTHFVHAVTPANLFRGPTVGDLAGPYVSQFLVLPIQQETFSSSHYSYEQVYMVPVEGMPGWG